MTFSQERAVSLRTKHAKFDSAPLTEDGTGIGHQWGGGTSVVGGAYILVFNQNGVYVEDRLL